ncbi:MAG: FixH family protein [Bacillus sp. (in: Bacteria)]|nr:FixH family protein [Bacillus sp. (in: firmicutes)]
MKNKLLIIVLLALALIITACGSGNDSPQGSAPPLNLEPLEVELIVPETADPDTDVVIQALVTQGEEKVNDADEVVFEIWQRNQKENSEMIEAILTDEDGLYEITYVFSEENLYFVQPHVTARGMHRMPLGEIAVGDVPEEVEGTEEDHEHGHHDHDHHHQHGDLTLTWNTEEVVPLNEEVEISVAVEWQGETWTDGRVRFEIWHEDDHVHQWIDGEETEAGLYTLTHSFDKAGEHYIIIHLEDEHIHEHVLKTVQVHDEDGHGH